MTFDWKSIIGTVAPALASALGGPLAGSAIAAIGKALGLNNATEKDLEKTLQTLTPEQIVAIRQADQDFAVRMKELDIDLAQINMYDRDSARNREVTTGDSKTPRWLSIGALAVFMLLIVSTFFLVFIFTQLPDRPTLPSELWMLLSSLIGLAGGLASQAYSYYLGSNSDASRRDEMLYNNTPTEQKLMEAAASALHQSSKKQ